MSVEYCAELFDSDASWGPGTKLAEIWDARNLGWSRYDRLAGKAFATLPQTSPFLSLIQKLRTHFRVTRVASSGNTEVFNGLIIDPDSTGDDVILDVLDYTGLCATSRAGYRKMYATQALGTGIVAPEWALAKTATGSRLAFVTTGAIQDPVASDGVTVIKTNATFGLMDQMRLQLFYDLSEMGRANTAYNVSYEISRTSPFTFTFSKNKGTLSAIPLVLNGTVSEYRHLTGWSSYKNDVATIGTTTAGGASEITKADASAITSLGLWQDVGTIKSLLGIAGALTEQDQQVAATGRMLNRLMQAQEALALLLVPGAIEPFTGWDINDTMPLEIVNGVDNITGTWRVVGTRCIYDEAGESLSLIVTPVLT